jgi:hypothetical protein
MAEYKGPVTEADEKQDGGYRMAKFKHQNAQLLKAPLKSEAPPAPTPGSSPLPKATPATKGSSTDASPATRK